MLGFVERKKGFIWSSANWTSPLKSQGGSLGSIHQRLSRARLGWQRLSTTQLGGEYPETDGKSPQKQKKEKVKAQLLQSHLEGGAETYGQRAGGLLPLR